MSKFCNHCGASVGEEDRFCTVCGKPITAESAAEQPKAPHEESQKKEELDQEPITMGGYLIMFLIMCIPVVNLVVLLLWAFGKNGNVNRRNFSRAALIYIAIGIALTVGAMLFFIGMIANVVQYEQYHRYEHYGDPYMDYWEYYDDEYLPDSTDDFIFSITEGNAPAEDWELHGVTISGV